MHFAKLQNLFVKNVDTISTCLSMIILVLLRITQGILINVAQKRALYATKNNEQNNQTSNVITRVYRPSCPNTKPHKW